MGPYEPPPDGVGAADLAGTWRAHYVVCGEDTLIIKAGGTFKQIYQNERLTWIGNCPNYTWDSGWHEWYLESLANGGVVLHLVGARYYKDGIDLVEREGLPGETSWTFHDPTVPRKTGTEGLIHMVGELALHVRWDEREDELVLYQFFGSPEEGPGIIGPSSEFRRTTAP